MLNGRFCELNDQKFPEEDLRIHSPPLLQLNQILDRLMCITVLVTVHDTPYCMERNYNYSVSK